MPGTPTTRLSLPTINGATDAVSSYPSVNTSQMGTLDNAAIYQSGTLAARPATPVAGTFYFATDGPTLYCYDGSAWLLAGHPDTGWVALSLNAGWANGTTVTPSYRVIGDRVWFKGEAENTSGSTVTAGAVIANIPSPYRPSALTQEPFVGSAFGAINNTTITVAANGNVTNTQSLTNAGVALLEGWSYSLT